MPLLIYIFAIVDIVVFFVSHSQAEKKRQMQQSQKKETKAMDGLSPASFNNDLAVQLMIKQVLKYMKNCNNSPVRQIVPHLLGSSSEIQ
eukprot:3916989-Ditylum_brightwellii.AAC.1